MLEDIGQSNVSPFYVACLYDICYNVHVSNCLIVELGENVWEMVIKEESRTVMMSTNISMMMVV